MNRTLTHISGQAARYRPKLEVLEVRRLFAGSLGDGLSGTVPPPLSASTTPAAVNLAVVQTSPADGATLSGSPSSISVTFNMPLNPAFVTTDFELEQVNSDGSTTVLQPSALTEPFLTAPAATLVVTLNQTLLPGHYRLLLLQSSGLVSTTGVGLASTGQDQPLADFTILPAKSFGLSTATPLGRIGSSVTTVSGALNFQNDTTDVDLYKFTLPPGNSWQLGVAVLAQEIGSPLSSNLVLFNQTGQVLKTSTVGLPTSLSDPYLFTGLSGGTYYIGVSGAGNTPDKTGGYNPILGSEGTIGQNQPGGPYQLSVVVTPANAPVRLRSFTLNQADPTDTRPTGLTLTFSGPINFDQLTGTPFPALKVVDQSGQVWSLVPLSYDSHKAQATFAFVSPLPPGSYKLVIPQQGGLTDLAGLTPVAAGEPAGVLANWSVNPSSAPPNPLNLGTVPGSAAGIQASTSLAPGQSVSYRFVVAFQTPYAIQALVSGGTLTAQVSGPTQLALSPDGPGRYQTTGAQLQSGIYHLVLTNTGSTPLTVSWSARMDSVEHEAILVNGLGQESALDLRLVSAPSPDASTGVVAATSSSTPATAMSQPFGISLSSGKLGLEIPLTITVNPVGGPSSEGLQVGPVGPGTTALAAASPGVLQGITFGQSLSSSFSLTGEPTRTLATSGDSLASINGALVSNVDLPRPAPDLDAVALADAGRLRELASQLRDWLAKPLRFTAPQSTGAPRILLARDDLVDRSDQVEQASLAMPMGFGIVSIVSVWLRHPIERWRSRRRERLQGNRQVRNAVRLSPRFGGRKWLEAPRAPVPHLPLPSRFPLVRRSHKRASAPR
jgi:methionine-rich copper-binding protein CopC